MSGPRNNPDGNDETLHLLRNLPTQTATTTKVWTIRTHANDTDFHAIAIIAQGA
jgi:hypothetical protein